MRIKADYVDEPNMQKLAMLMAQRRKRLKTVMKNAQARLNRSPEGTIRISRSGGRKQYYYRKEPSDRQGTYIAAGSNMELIRRLIRKSYDLKVCRAAEKEIAAIDTYLKLCPDAGIEDIYLSLNAERQNMIVPVEETEEMFVKNWTEVIYEGKDFFEDIPVLLTDKGERVRSKSEVIIANALSAEGVPYRYEYPLYLETMGTVYPDFTVLNVRQRKEMLWEHLGMMDNEEYACAAVKKERAYNRSGIFQGDRLIVTSETSRDPLDTSQVKELIEHYLL